MIWYVARVGDPVATHVLLDEIRLEAGNARERGGVPSGAKVYAVTEASSVAFYFNEAARELCTSLRTLEAPTTPPPAWPDRKDSLI